MELLPLRRTSQGAVLGGVCAGLARRWRLDPVVLRVAFVVLGLFSGLGLALYVGALLLVPKDGASEYPVRGMVPATRSWSEPAVIGAVVGLGVLIMVTLGGLSPIGLGPAIGLSLLWYFGWYRHRANHGSAPARPGVEQQPSEFQRAADAWRARVAEHREQSAALTFPADTVTPLTLFGAPTPVAPAVPAVVTPSPLPVPTRARHRSAGWLWPATAAVVGAQLVGLVLLGVVSGTEVSSTVYVACSLAWVAVALVVSAFVGRPRWLMATGVALALATLLSLASVERPQQVTVGSDTWPYAAISDLPAVRTMDAGEVTVDLRELPVDADADVTFRVRLGELTLQLPATGNVVVDWSVTAGSASLPGETNTIDGVTIADEFRRGTDPTQPTLRVHLEVDLGEIRVIS